MAVIIVGLLVVSFTMFFYSMNRYKTFKLLNRDEREKYKFIARKMKAERTEEEQEFYFQTQDSYYSLQISKYSFLLAIILIVVYRFYIVFL
jgi:hypothetical protein